MVERRDGRRDSAGSAPPNEARIAANAAAHRYSGDQPEVGESDVDGGPTDTTDMEQQSALVGLLFCATCQRQMIPMARINGRAYGSPCGCRLAPVDALTVERLVFNAVEANHPDILTGVAASDLLAVFHQVLAEVRIGGAADELEFIWST